MTGSGRWRPFRRVLGPTSPVLVLALLVLAYGSDLPLLPALALAILGSAAGLALRASRSSTLYGLAAAPVLLALGILAATTPIAPLPELLAGAAGVVFIAWLTDDPSRPPAGASRGALVWAIPGLGMGVAWASAFLLPSSAASVGVAGGLLAASLLVLAYVVARPEMFDRDMASTI
jgi:hypothetical protein